MEKPVREEQVVHPPMELCAGFTPVTSPENPPESRADVVETGEVEGDDITRSHDEQPIPRSERAERAKKRSKLEKEGGPQAEDSWVVSFGRCPGNPEVGTEVAASAFDPMVLESLVRVWPTTLVHSKDGPPLRPATNMQMKAIHFL